MRAYSGTVYSAAFRSTTLSTNPHDLFGITAPSNSKVRIREILIAEISPDNDGVGVELLRGSTIASIGAALTPQNLKGWASAPTAGSSVTGPSTTLVSTASATRIHAGAFTENLFHYRPAPIAAPILAEGQRLHVRITAPATGSISGSITFEEIGQVP